MNDQPQQPEIEKITGTIGARPRPLPPPPQYRPARKQMIATLRACDVILATVHQKEDLRKAVECLVRMSRMWRNSKRRWRTEDALQENLEAQSQGRDAS